VCVCVDITVCRAVLAFITSLYKVYCDLYFTYLEVNPLGKSPVALPFAGIFSTVFVSGILLLDSISHLLVN